MSRQIKIAFFDIDGTLHTGPSSWELVHIANGTWDTLGKRYLEEYYEGKIDFETFAELDVQSWKNMREDVFIETIKQIPLYPEVPFIFNYLQELGIKIYIISSGLAPFAEYLCEEYSLDGYVANDILIEKGKLTGEIELNVKYYEKGDIVKEILAAHDLSSKHAFAIGDGEGDVPMFNEVKYPVFFSPNNKVLTNYTGFSASTWQEVFAYIKNLN